MKFIALLDACGGCDHNIDCGKTWVKFTAKTWDAAFDRVRRQITQYGRPTEGPTPEEVIILRVSGSRVFDVPAYWAERDAAKSRKLQEKITEEEKALYERLKRKYK